MHDFRIITYLRTTEEFYDRDRLRVFIEGLAAHGHYVAGEDWREVGQVWKATLNGESPKISVPEPERVFTPGVSPILWNDTETFVEEHSDFLAIYLFSTPRNGDLRAVEITIDLEPEERTITLSMLANRDVLAPFLHCLDILQYIYETWHPLYSYKEGGVPDTTYEDALANNVTLLYDMNLLNSDMVEKLGKQRVISTPAWRVTPLEDGSVFLIPKLIYHGGQDEDYAYNKEVAASHLGLRAP